MKRLIHHASSRPDEQAVARFVRQMLDSTPVAAAMIDVSGHVREANVAGLRLLGALDKAPDVTAFVAPAERAAMVAAWAGGGRWSGNVTVPMRGCPDAVRTMTISGFGDASLDGYVAVAIFEEPGLRRSNQQPLSIASVIIVGTTIVYATPATLELLGAEAASDVVGRDVFQFIASDSIAATLARHQSAAAGVWPKPDALVLQRLDGVEVSVEIASTPVFWGDEPASQVTIWESAPS